MATSAFLLSRQCPQLLGAGTRSLGSGALRGGLRQHGMFNRSIVTLSGLSRFDRLPSLTLTEKFNQFQGSEDERLLRAWDKCKLHTATQSEEMDDKQEPGRSSTTYQRVCYIPYYSWYFLVHHHHAAALSLFAYAGITDLVDGYIARRWNLQTVVGTIIDPMADKLLMTIGVACLAVNGSIPVWLAVIILGRDVGLAISAIYYRWISLPPPKTMARYWDFSLPSAEVKPTEISKINTALQLLLVGSAIALPVLPETFLDAWHLREAMTGFQYLVAGTTIWSGLSYVFSKNAVKILTKEEVQRRIARGSTKKGS